MDFLLPMSGRADKGGRCAEEATVRISLRTKGKSRFFLLHQNAMNTHKAAKALSDLMADFTDVDAKIDEINAMARLGSEIAQQTSAALHETPRDRRLTLSGPSISRRDALRLTHRLNAMTASISRAAAAAPSDETNVPPAAVMEAAASVAARARELEKAIGALSAAGAKGLSLAAAQQVSEAASAPHPWTEVQRQLSKALESGRSAAGALRAVAGKG